MNSVLNLTYKSSLSRLRELNSSFDTGVMRVAYHGQNRNGSSISKAAFERSIETIWNCPVVCNYDRESDSIGSHDVEVVEKNGTVCLVNVTHPVGVIPESANTYWELVEEADGSTHEYLCVDVLLWKRQEAYQKIVEDGIESQSMEISVKEGELVDNVFHINRFEFTAFCLLGSARPCFESASLELFSHNEFKQQFSEMMQDVKKTIIDIRSAKQVEDNKTSLSEGGDFAMEEKNALMAEFNIDPDSLDFDVNEFTLEELRAKFEELNQVNAVTASEPVAEPTEMYALADQVREGLIEVISLERIETEFGSRPRYYFVDFDYELNELYVYDAEDWRLYGMAYSMNGDSAVVDFDSKKRKKYAIVDFNEGDDTDTQSVFASVFEEVSAQFATMKAELAETSGKLENANVELDELREFKTTATDELLAYRKADAKERFADLVGIEEFDNLCERIAEFGKSDFEDQCYMLRGKNTATFSQKPESTRLPVMGHGESIENEPYGGLFLKFAKKA